MLVSHNDPPAPWAGLKASGPVLRLPEAAAYLGVSSSSYYRYAQQGLVPPTIKIGLQAVGVPQNWLDAVVAKGAEAAL